jgi:hypothetical protein
MNKFIFKNGYRIKGINAQTAGEELARIAQDRGELKAPDVVDEARPQDALLHPAFEWNDQIAAELHRQDQARYLIRDRTNRTAHNQNQQSPPKNQTPCQQQSSQSHLGRTVTPA